MGTLIESYEQQYSSLTAEITFNIGRISNTHGGKYSFFVRISSEFGYKVVIVKQCKTWIKNVTD